MRPREVSSLFLSPTLPCLLAPAGYAEAHSLQAFARLLRTPEADSGRPRPLLSSFIAGVAWASAHTQAGNFSARMSTGWISGARRAVPRPGRAGRRRPRLEDAPAAPRRCRSCQRFQSSLIDPEGVPGDRSGLLGDEFLGACKKCGDLFFLSRLCLQRDRQGDFLH